MKNHKLRQKAIRLRAQGKTYSEIRKSLKVNIPKSTMTYWCHDVKLPKNYNKKIKENNLIHINTIRQLAIKANHKKHQGKLNKITIDYKHLPDYLNDKEIGKIILAMLYLCEGTKNNKNAHLTFGNSDPLIINLFLQLLRFCYIIDEDKFRCTWQGRADQKIKSLEKFWSKLTQIPLRQFYQARIDPRTTGKKSIKPNYKGVCRIDYFSGEIFWELTKIGELICLSKKI